MQMSHSPTFGTYFKAPQNALDQIKTKLEK